MMPRKIPDKHYSRIYYRLHRKRILELQHANRKGKKRKHAPYTSKIREQARRYYQLHRERILERTKQYSRTNKSRQREYVYFSHLRRKFKLDKSKYQEYLSRQDGLCAICQNPPKQRLRVDHSHVTGKIRGLLCADCNFGLGMFRDDIERFQRAIAYLIEHEAVPVPATLAVDKLQGKQNYRDFYEQLELLQ